MLLVHKVCRAKHLFAHCRLDQEDDVDNHDDPVDDAYAAHGQGRVPLVVAGALLVVLDGDGSGGQVQDAQEQHVEQVLKKKITDRGQKCNSGRATVCVFFCSRFRGPGNQFGR